MTKIIVKYVEASVDGSKIFKNHHELADTPEKEDGAEIQFFKINGGKWEFKQGKYSPRTETIWKNIRRIKFPPSVKSRWVKKKSKKTHK